MITSSLRTSKKLTKPHILFSSRYKMWIFRAALVPMMAGAKERNRVQGLNELVKVYINSRNNHDHVTTKDLPV